MITKPNQRNKPRVLVVDDQNEMLFCISKAFESRGYEVVLASDGNEAIASIEVFDPELVILDIMMPKRSGILVLEFMRTEIKKPIPVIMITGSEGNRHREYAEHFGISDYMVKPFQISELLNSADRAINPSAAQSD